jgi:hypothetical protein
MSGIRGYSLWFNLNYMNKIGWVWLGTGKISLKGKLLGSLLEI